MLRKFSWSISLISFCFLMIFSFSTPAAASEDDFIFGLLMVGPYNDHGWSQAHYEAGKYVEEKLPETKMIYIDKVNPADRPGVTIPQLVDDLVSKGAKMIIASSDDMKDGIREAAFMHPDIHFLHVSGDDALTGKGPANLSNVMGRMEYGKMIAGFTAAMTTQTGKIGYLGPLINEETRRLAASCFLGAKYAWENVRHKNSADLSFKVTWIGFWFNIPGVTADPTQVAQNFFNTGRDVVVSGIDTTEALVVARQKKQEGNKVWAIPYDFEGACTGAEDICLGVPYFNWGPDYIKFIQEAKSGKWEKKWIWSGPYWEDINDRDRSAVGFSPGPALATDVKGSIDGFIEDLASGRVELFKGPLNYQDRSPFLNPGEIATDEQIWYMEQLLEGMEGQSKAK